MFQKTTSASHQRSKSSPYLQQAPTDYANNPSVADYDYAPSDILLAPPVALTARTPRQHPHFKSTAELRGHQRTLTDLGASENQLPSLDTHGSANDHPASPIGLGLSPSLFSSSKDISFTPSPYQSPQLSPTKEKRSFLQSFSNDAPAEGKTAGKSIRVADWFQGQSAPVNLGIPAISVKEKEDSVNDSNKLQRRSTLTPSNRPAMTSMGRFSLFGSKASLPEQKASDIGDELANLDIRIALQPRGPSDPFSPSSFKNLLQHAEGLLSRLQTAYKERSTTLREVEAEKEAQAEELEEARTRAKHLKMQLDDMATKMAEQDAAMMSLVDELAEQKKWRQDLEARRTIRIVEADDEARGQPVRRKKRTSRASEVSDSAYDSQTDDDSPADSVFSAAEVSRSTSISMATSPSIASPESAYEPEFSRPESRTLPPLLTRCDTQVLAQQRGPQTPASCANCEGVKASEAYGIVSMLKMENKGLKQRVQHLEDNLDGCLDLVRGLGVK
ncbi:hypothetical protein MMC30_005374 [Trapelia coarctata]|nr:hypothetical protein [Trapelia coarctata]